jgi:uncharacterized protein DUF4345
MVSMLVIAVAVFFLGMGIVALWRPALILGLFGTAVTTSEGRNEVRAVYGGYGVAMGVLLAGSLATPTPLRSGILLRVAVATLGMAVGRLISFGIDGRAGFYPLLFLGVEVALLASLLGAVFADA